MFRPIPFLVAAAVLVSCDLGPPDDPLPGDAGPPLIDAGVSDAGTSPDAGAPVSFDRDVWPSLRLYCVTCHDGPFRGDFRTAGTAYAALFEQNRAVGLICNGGETPRLPVITPGDPERSGLWRLVGVGYRGCGWVYGMPKNDSRGILKDIDPAAVEAIRAWILQGAQR